VRQHFDRSERRANELIEVGEGRKTLADLREETREKGARHRAK
jgi:hypothetical protein